jgi:hypothetical protein
MKRLMDVSDEVENVLEREKALGVGRSRICEFRLKLGNLVDNAVLCRARACRNA